MNYSFIAAGGSDTIIYEGWVLGRELCVFSYHSSSERPSSVSAYAETAPPEEKL